MSKLPVIAFLVIGLWGTADADIWKWVDDDGNIHYGDLPAREYSKSAELVRHTTGRRSTSNDSRTDIHSRNDSDSAETSQEQQSREEAQTYYCEQARGIYRSYANAPRLYRTSDDGEREYLSDEEMAATIADAEASVAEWCN